MNEVLRKEKKFLININDFFKATKTLDCLIQQDKNNGLNGYIVRSLYFETLDNKDFYNKIDGLNLRRKIRLRVYRPDSEYAALEMKQKEGDNQLKRSLRVNREDAKQIIKGDYSPLLTYEEPFAKECYCLMNELCYRPSAVVQYNRKAYIAKENKIRITFDSNIVASESNFDIFSDKINLNPVFNPFNIVLEVKYNGFLLNYIQDIINSIDKSELSVSKYCLSRAMTLQYEF